MDKPNASESELAIVSQFLSKQMTDGFNGIHQRLTEFETEIRPQLQEHGEAIAVLQSKQRNGSKKSLFTASLTGGSVMAIIEGVKQLVHFMQGKH